MGWQGYCFIFTWEVGIGCTSTRLLFCTEKCVWTRAIERFNEVLREDGSSRGYEPYCRVERRGKGTMRLEFWPKGGQEVDGLANLVDPVISAFTPYFHDRSRHPRRRHTTRQQRPAFLLVSLVDSLCFRSRNCCVFLSLCLPKLGPLSFSA